MPKLFAKLKQLNAKMEIKKKKNKNQKWNKILNGIQIRSSAAKYKEEKKNNNNQTKLENRETKFSI